MEARTEEPTQEQGNTIRVVSSRTGLSMDVLRAWERRYGFPAPERRPDSNRRLYSETDVERLAMIAQTISSGYRVGDVISKSKAKLGRLLGRPEQVFHRADDVPTVESVLDALREDDLPRLDRELRLAADLLGADRFVREIAHGSAMAVGEEWARGELSIRHEHIFAESLTTQLRRLLFEARLDPTGPLVLLTTLPGEPHTLALQMVAILLTNAGLVPRLMGASTPAPQIAQAARALGAHAIGLTITSVSNLRSAKNAVSTLASTLPVGTELWLGGDAAERVAAAVPRASALMSWDRILAAATRLKRASQSGVF